MPRGPLDCYTLNIELLLWLKRKLFFFFSFFFLDIYVRYDVNVGDPPAKVNLPLNWDATTVTLHCFVSFCATRLRFCENQ